MPSTLTEQIGVASGGAHWDIAGFRLFDSTVPGVLLFVPLSLRLAKEGERYQATVTRMQRWRMTAYEVSGGSAMLSVFGDTSISDIAPTLEDQWRQVILNTGYKGSANPRFLPLPVREVRLTAMMDPLQGRVAANAPNTQQSRTLALDLTSAGVLAWDRAIREKSTVTGGIRLSYLYPQLMPQLAARVTVHGARVYIKLAATLSKDDDGSVYGSSEDIRAAWSVLVREGAIEIVPADAANSNADIFDRVSDQAREQLMDALFTPYLLQGSNAGLLYTLRWKSAADAADVSMTITVEGWTWLNASLEAEFSALLNALDESYIHVSYELVSVPVSLVVEPSTTATSVAVSLDFSEGHVPEAPLFDAAGGMRQFQIATQRPEAVSVSYRVKAVFQPSNWPVVDASGTAALTSDGYRIVVRPDTWVRRHTVYMYVRRGDRIVPPAEADPADYLAMTANYQAPYLGMPIRAASRITPHGPVEFSYPVPPGQHVGRATLGAVGMVGGQLVRAADLEIQDTEDAIYLMVDSARIQIVGRNAVVSESDKLVGRLRSANARPLVADRIAPSAEDTRDIDVDMQVALIPQPTDVSCWAASLAMVVSARDSASTTPERVAFQAGMDLTMGYGWTDIQRAVVAWHLVDEGPRSAMPQEWARLLGEWGPIWLVEVGAPYHAVVLGGMRGDGTPEGTYVIVYNPWPPGVGAVESKTFYEFAEEFGLGAEAGAAMVHARQ